MSGINFCKITQLLCHIRSVTEKINMEYQRKITGRKNFDYSPMFHPWVQIMRIDWNSPVGAWVQGHLLVCICSVFSTIWYKAMKEKHSQGLLVTSLMHLKLSADFRKRLSRSRTSVESPEDFSCLRYHLSPPPVLNGDLERDWQWFSFTSRFPLVQKTPLKSRVSHA